MQLTPKLQALSTLLNARRYAINGELWRSHLRAYRDTDLIFTRAIWALVNDLDLAEVDGGLLLISLDAARDSRAA